MENDFELVFVHLGKAKAPHIWKNIAKVRTHWPSISIVLITDSEINQIRGEKMGIKTWNYVPDATVRSLFDAMTHNANFRQGFWNYSLMRLFAVLDYVEMSSKLSVIHIESDIMLFPNFPFREFLEIKKPAWMRFNESHDVGSIFYIPNSVSAKELKSVFVEILSENPSLTDMTLLSTVARKYTSLATYLPVASSSESTIIREDIRGLGEANSLAENYDVFQGVFDSAPIGMWLLGQDPRNHLGRILRFRELAESYIQPQSTKYTFDSGHQTLETSTGEQIFNLHVHSKEISYFGNRRAQKITSRVKESIYGAKSSTFDIRSFVALSRDFFERNGIRGIPKKIKSFLKSSP